MKNKVDANAIAIGRAGGQSECGDRGGVLWDFDFFEF